MICAGYTRPAPTTTTARRPLVAWSYVEGTWVTGQRTRPTTPPPRSVTDIRAAVVVIEHQSAA